MALDLIVVENGELTRIVDPDTGEAVALDDATPQLLAAVLGRIKLAEEDFLARTADAKRILGATMIERMDGEAEWTQRSRGVKVTAPSSARGTVRWSGDELHTALAELVQAKVITQAAALRACEIVVTYKPVMAGVNKLLKNPKAAPRILLARHDVDPPRRSVSITVDPGEI